MKAGTLRTYKVVHTWVGILSGVMLFIAFYAGAWTMFKPEAGRWAQAPATAQQRVTSPIDPLAQAFFATRDKAIGSALLVLDPARPGYGHIEYADAHGAVQRVTQDAAGRLRTTAAQTGPAGEFVDAVHRNGGLPMAVEISEPIIGLVALLYALALVSGIVVLLPSLLKDLLVLRITANVKRFWLDAHNLIGITSLPFHLAIAVTTAGFCLHDWVYDTQDATIHAIGEAAAPPRARGPAATSASWVAPSALLATAAARSATFTPVDLHYRGLNSPRPSVNMGGTDSTGHTRSPRAGYMNFNPVTGAIHRGVNLQPGAQNNWEATLAAIFALHFGSYGGLPVRFAYAVMGVLGAVLFYTGNLLWIESRLRKDRQARGALAQPRHVRVVAALTVGLCLGALIGLPLGLVAMRWQDAMQVGSHAIGIALFNAALGGATVLALIKGAGWAGYRLALAAALASLLVPATGLLGVLLPDVSVAKPYLADYLWIDGFGLLAGIVLLWLWRRALRRARAGAVQSVWHEPQEAKAGQEHRAGQESGQGQGVAARAASVPCDRQAG